MKYATRIHRLFRLITTLQSGSARSADGLAEHLGVSRRTLFRDLKVLEASGVPYRYEAGAGYAIEPEFFLPPVNLRTSEAEGLVALCRLTLGQGPSPVFDGAAEALRKIMATLPESVRQGCDRTLRDISVDAAPVHTGPSADVFSALRRAVQDHRVIELSVAGAEPRPIHPRHLRLADGRWHLFFQEAASGEVDVVTLGSEARITLTDRYFEPVTPFDVNHHLGHAWRVRPEGRVEKIEIRFEASAARSVIGACWHFTQDLEPLEDGTCQARFEVDGLEEIAGWIAGFGDGARVIRPAALRKRVEVLRAAAPSSTPSMA